MNGTKGPARAALRFTTMDTPLGRLVLRGDGEALTGIDLPDEGGRDNPGEGWREDPEAFREAVSQLEEYFAGRRRRFELRLRPAGRGGSPGTAFQRGVWEAMAAIPFGTTVSYSELARRVGAPAAVRAVGAACGANPLPIVIPCHRVVGSGGRLTGYRGGLETKRRLLALEAGQGDWRLEPAR